MSDMNGGTGTALVQRVEDTARQVSTFGSGEAFNTAQRVARALSESTVVPEAYRGNLPNVLVAMEYANRLGASVLAVMQNLDVIHGRPSLRASFLIGTVNACGRFSPIRYRWQGKEGTDDWGCRAVAKDMATGEECTGPLITIALAKAEGWYGKAGSKWKTVPELMLMYRAGAWWSRVYCPELSLGLHTSDEAEDIAPPAVVRVQAAAAALDAGDPAPAADMNAAPTGGEVTQLQSLIDKAAAAGKITPLEVEGFELAVEEKNGKVVRDGIRDLQKSLAGV